MSFLLASFKGSYHVLSLVPLQEAAKTVVGRLGKPEEIASLVSYLASAESEFTTGQTVVFFLTWVCQRILTDTFAA